MAEIKVDLALLNKLVKELNDEFAKATALKDHESVNRHDYVAASGKCLGLANTIALEATALTHDYLKEIKTHSMEPNSVNPYAGLTDEGESLDPFGLGGIFKKKN